MLLLVELLHDVFQIVHLFAGRPHHDVERFANKLSADKKECDHAAAEDHKDEIAHQLGGQTWRRSFHCSTPLQSLRSCRGLPPS
jgi:hypothetical protein